MPAEIGGWDEVMSREGQGRLLGKILEVGVERKGRPKKEVCYKLGMNLGTEFGGE